MRAILGLFAFNVIALALAVSGAAAQSDRPEVVVGRIDGIINPVMAAYVNRVISNAESSNAAAVVWPSTAPRTSR